MIGYIYRPIKRNIVDPLLGLKDSPERIALGVSIGIFFALTPTVGIQMAAVAAAAAVARAYNVFIRRFFPSDEKPGHSRLPELHFNIPAGIAMVWVSNPLTMIPMYYFMYLIGVWVLRIEPEHFEFFSTKWNEILAMDSTWEQIRGYLSVLGDLAGPMMLGGIIWGIVAALVLYPVARRLVVRHRTRKAAALGVTYAEYAERLRIEHERELHVGSSLIGDLRKDIRQEKEKAVETRLDGKPDAGE